eukprot:7391495-Prymnesium_polylepis.1
MNALSGLVEVVKYVILMDADPDFSGKGEAFIRGIAPMNDVLYLQGTQPAQQRTMFYGFSKIKAHKDAFNDRFELDLYRSRAARLRGQPNRTFYGGALPKQVIARAKQSVDLGIACEPTGYHGQMSPDVRRDHFANPNVRMEPHDLIASNTVMAVGTDLGLKVSHAYFESKRGDIMHGAPTNEQFAQLTGRPGRDARQPLDGLDVGGVHHPCAMFLLINGDPPSRLDTDTTGIDRVQRKFNTVRNDEARRLNAARAQDEAMVRAYQQRIGLTLDTGSGAAEVPVVATPQSIESSLKEILTWNEVSKRDQSDDHAISLLELMALPTRGYMLLHMPRLSDIERAELEAFRRAEKASPATALSMTEDQQVGSFVNVKDKYNWVKDHVQEAQRTDCNAEARFWQDCNGLCVKGSGGGGTGDARAELMRSVWRTLQPMKYWVHEDHYADLHMDRDRGNVMNRALMLYVPHADIQMAYSKAQKTGHTGDTISKNSLPAAAKMPLLRKFADAVQLSLEDLLKPRLFEEVDGHASHAWLKMHNLIQRGGGTPAEVDAANRMADAARSIAKDMDCKGITGPTAKKPTTLFKTIEHVLVQQCAMRTVKNPARQGKRDPTLAPMRGGRES